MNDTSPRNISPIREDTRGADDTATLSATDTRKPDIPPARHSAIRAGAVKVCRYLIPVLVSVILVWWLFHKVSLHTVISIMRRGCDYRWLLLMCMVLVASRSVRGIRWGLQLRAAGVRRMPPFAEMVSIYGAYALDLVFTGVGEAWRCIYVSRRQKAPLSTVIGTDLGDRISDAIVIVALLGVTILVAGGPIGRFMDRYRFGRDIGDTLASPWFWIVLAAIAITGLWLAFGHGDNRWIRAIRTGCGRMWGGFKVLFTMKRQWLFWTYTVIIWVCYFLMTYLCFFAFPFTQTLIRPEYCYGLLPGLVVFMFGSLSIAVPSTGGLGPWNLAVIFALTLYGVSEQDAAAYSMVVWGFQTATQILLGITGAGYIAIHRHDSRPHGPAYGTAS